MLNLIKLFRFSICLLLGVTVSGVVVSVSGQSTKTGDDPNSAWVNNSILEKAPYVNAEKVENRGVIDAATPDNVPFYFFNTKYFIIIRLVKLLVLLTNFLLAALK